MRRCALADIAIRRAQAWSRKASILMQNKTGELSKWRPGFVYAQGTVDTESTTCYTFYLEKWKGIYIDDKCK